MREIRFRACAVEEMVGSQWLLGSFVEKVLFSEEHAKEMGRDSDCYLYTESGFIRVHEKSAGQYSGIRDKNSADIYEGHIVRVESSRSEFYNGVVKFGSYPQDGSGGEYAPTFCIGFYIEAVDPEARDEDGYDILNDYEVTTSIQSFEPYEIEIIGNVFEHPHLLKGE